VQAFYTDRFVLPLPVGHRFPMEKYRMLREQVAAQLPEVRLAEPPAASDADLARAHDPKYIARLAGGDLTKTEQQKIGFPWSEAMVARSRRSAGATLAACRTALTTQSIAVNLAGGTHHAYPDRGEGFCCFNDAAVAARAMQAEGLAHRVLILDLDVHQGNGTAVIFQHDPTVFTVSVHGEDNYPFHKETSDIDRGLPNGTGDADYLACLDDVLEQTQREFSPDLLIYLAGADPLASDRLGRLALSHTGLERRDQRVLDFAEARGLPVAVAMAGGYARPIEDTVTAHFNTVRLCYAFSRMRGATATTEYG
jgi:acetoin utilization deacetylase AcuC-like enzyme